MYLMVCVPIEVPNDGRLILTTADQYTVLMAYL